MLILGNFEVCLKATFLDVRAGHVYNKGIRPWPLRSHIFSLVESVMGPRF
jgi:hypothetical protein